jgi:rhodanese-related sulfurtransferase
VGARVAEEQRNGALLLDVRAPEQFVSFHIRGAVQIGLVGPFASWAAILIDPAQEVVLIAEDIQGVNEAHTRLCRVGIRQVIGYSLADEMQWRSEGMDIATISTQHCDGVHRTLLSGSLLQLIDVRSHAEWLRGHLPGAVSVPLPDLELETQHIDRSKPSLVYCREEYRATTAASLLLLKWPGDIGVLIDGVEGWSALGLPLEIPRVNPSIDSPLSPAL